jgi:hypothetical protein
MIVKTYTFFLVSFLLVSITGAKTYIGNPANYLQMKDSLQAGDSLVLETGDYTSGLNLSDMHGTDNNWIVITAQDQHTAVLVARDWNNTMNIVNCSYIKIAGLKFDGKNYPGIDAIKAQGADTTYYAHHIWIENNVIENHGGSQQTVGISTKITSWDWTMRKNRIIGAGTGMYLGNSDGSRPFIRGLIEQNLILYATGYCMQIKHQNDRPDIPGIPMEDVTTVIRHNVFAKDDRPSPSGDRPNLLVSGTFETGPGSEDRYEIYGNFLFYNPRESLFQGSGNISLHNNIFAVSDRQAVNFQEHHGRKPKELFVYCNTLYHTTRGISLAGEDTNYDQIFKGNAVYAATPVSGIQNFEVNNRAGTVAEAASVFFSPADSVGTMDFYPLPGALQATVDLSDFNSKDAAWNLDFNNSPQDGSFYGAYSGEGTNPGWKLALDIKNIGNVSIKDGFSKKFLGNQLYLEINVHNSVRRSANIHFYIPYESHVTLHVYSVSGRHIACLFDRYTTSGKYCTRFSPKIISSGMYIVTLKSDRNVINERIILLNY